MFNSTSAETLSCKLGMHAHGLLIFDTPGGEPISDAAVSKVERGRACFLEAGGSEVCCFISEMYVADYHYKQVIVCQARWKERNRAIAF